MKKNGFTLIELLGVIAILAIIGTIATAAVISSVKKARDKQARIHEDNLLETAVSYVYLAKGTCPNGTISEETTLVNCITQKCPSDFITKNASGVLIVNTRYSASSNPYKSCSIKIKAGDIMTGVGTTRRYDSANESLERGDQPLFDGDKTYCKDNGYVLVYKDEYGSLEAISLTANICRK